jgi:phosphatidylglycerol:prolipoprotein diacylglycerol transferase
MGMLLSVPMILAGALIIVMAWRRNKPKSVPSPDQGTP